MSDWNDQVIAEFHAGKQRIAGMFDRSALLLLGTIGAKTGQARVSPLAYFTENDRLIVIASAGGADNHPHWYYNLLAKPQVSVQRWVGDSIESFDAIATDTEESERVRLFAKVSALMPGFAEYQNKTARVIPVVTLDRI